MRLLLCSGLATLALLAACERGEPIDYSGPVAGWDHWGGTVDLRGGPGDVKPGDYALTSPPVVVAGRIVLGGHIVDNARLDVPAQPVLFEFPTAGGPMPAVAQATIPGHIFILNRETGEPLVPVEERPVPRGGAVEGERPAATQPFPVNAACTVYPGDLSAESMWGFTPWDRGKCRDLFRKHRYEGRYSLPSLGGTVTFPFSNGFLNRGSVSIDPGRQSLVTNSTRIAAIVSMIPRSQADARLETGERLYPAVGSPYAFKHQWMLSPLGAPCNPPPWGTLLAIDLATGKRLREKPLGTTRGLATWPFWMKLGDSIVAFALTD